MKIFSQNSKIIKAFSLIELSIIVLLISLIASFLLYAKSSNKINEKTAITNKKLEVIYKAMGIYLAKNAKLPCPAAINLKESESTYGTASANCYGTPSSGAGYWQNSSHEFLYIGMVPVKTLGLPIEYSYDGFETKFSYTIINGFTNDEFFGQNVAKSDSVNPSCSNCYSTYTDDVTLGNGYRIFINDRKKDSSGVAVNSSLTNEAIFVITSHGSNKNGGWNRNSTTKNSTPSSDEEEWNSITTIDSPSDGKAAFYPHTGSGTLDHPYVTFSNIDENFDDVIFYKTRNQMIHDFKLYHLLPCTNNYTKEITYGADTSNYSWSGSQNIKYGELAQSSTNCPSDPDYTNSVQSPSVKCGKFGNWDSTIIHNCELVP
jgi:hypothetical protein